MAAERSVGPLAGVGQPGGIAHQVPSGLWQGIAVGSVALTGWALGGGSEGLASAMVLAVHRRRVATAGTAHTGCDAFWPRRFTGANPSAT